MSEQILSCPYCQTGWEIQLQDNFCGICGTRRFDYDAQWAGDNPILYAQKGKPTKQDWILVLKNRGLQSVSFEKIVGDPSNAISVQTDVADITLELAGERRVPISIDPALLPTGKGQLIVSSNGRQKTLPVNVQDEPEFDLTPQVADVVMPAEGTQGTVQLNLSARGGKFQLEDIKSDAPFVREILFDKDTLIDPGLQYPIQLDVDCSELQPGSHHDVALSFKLKWLEQPIDKQIELLPRIPPQIKCIEYGYIEMLPGEGQTYELAFQNIGGEPLVINRAIPHYRDEATGDWLPMSNGISPDSPTITDISLHRPANPSDSPALRFELRTPNCPPGLYVLRIDIISNAYTSPRFSHQLRVQVKAMVPLDDYIAFDFGTTNSCVAYFTGNSEIDVLEVETPDTDERGVILSTGEIFPSTIIYQATGEGKDCVVGREANRVRAMSPRDRLFYVSSAKRALGHSWDRDFPIGADGQLKPLAPREVVLDQIAAFLSKAERTLLKKVQRCVVTHPTLFSRRQLDDLRWVFEQWFKSQNRVVEEDTIFFIDEASAASLNYIYERQRDKNQDETYHILVYDFGGGTIDMILSRVIVKDGKVSVETLTSGGNPRFGGDDVTESIIEWMRNELITRLNENLETASSVDIPFRKQNRRIGPTNPRLVNIIGENSSNLYDAANRIKLYLTRLEEITAILPTLEYVEGVSQSPQGEVPATIGTNLSITRDQFEELIKPELEKTIGRIDAMIAEADAVPDIVILAGQSSQIPLVRKMIEAYFNKRADLESGVEIRMAGDAKELKACVVKGAAIYGDMLGAPDDGDLDISTFARRTHARFGLRGASGGRSRFREFIKKGIPIDGPISVTKNHNLMQARRLRVYEHFGAGDEINDASIELGAYVVDLPPNVQMEDLRQVPVEMTYTVDGRIELSVDINGEKYRCHPQRESPPVFDD